VVFKHQLDEWPPLAELVLLGLQWFPLPCLNFSLFLSFSPFLIGLLGGIPIRINLDDIASYLSTNHRQGECFQLSSWSTLS
jgi:hypothetical protein